MEIVARHYRTGQPARIEIEAGVYKAIYPLESTDTNLPWIAPGLVDVQINGGGGIDLNRPLQSAQDWEVITNHLYKHGCTHFLATLITNLRKHYVEILEILEPLRKARPRNCVGYHFEGPFLNPQPGYHGAHCVEWMTAPRYELLDEWQQLTHHGVKLVTIAPEVDLEAAKNFITKARSENVLISLGHCALIGENLDNSIEWGATCWTHLGNTVPNPMDKFQNVIFHALAREKLFASLIPDGKHIPPHVFKILSRSLGERLFLTTDAMAGAGAGPGLYSLCHMDIEVAEDGIARIPGQPYLAGSTLTPFTGVFYASEMSGLPWADMWDAFSLRPAKWLGLSHGLESGNEASFCLFNTEPTPQLTATYHRGEKVVGD